MKHDHPIELESDTFFNKPEKVEHMQEMGCDVIPVDINNAFVAVKGEAGNLAKTQANIRRRFNLGGES
jgi:hypothetical protein